jgi:hypothetical protein
MNSSNKLHVTVLDPALAQEAGDQLELGHYFVFVRDGRLSRERGRRGRLQAHRQSSRAVLAALTTPVEVAGLRITPPERALGPAVCLVADRDVYRAEQDTVRLFVVAPLIADYARLLYGQAVLAASSRAACGRCKIRSAQPWPTSARPRPSRGRDEVLSGAAAQEGLARRARGPQDAVDRARRGGRGAAGSSPGRGRGETSRHLERQRCGRYPAARQPEARRGPGRTLGHRQE